MFTKELKSIVDEGFLLISRQTWFAVFGKVGRRGQQVECANHCAQCRLPLLFAAKATGHRVITPFLGLQKPPQSRGNMRCKRVIQIPHIGIRFFRGSSLYLSVVCHNGNRLNYGGKNNARVCQNMALAHSPVTTSIVISVRKSRTKMKSVRAKLVWSKR